MFREDPIGISPKLATDILYWLDVLAETNDDPAITETIIALIAQMEGRERLQTIRDGQGQAESF